jgi:hypothetical protein
MSLRKPVKLTLRRCRWCCKEFLEIKSCRKATCACGGPANNYREPKLFYHADILYLIAWVAALVGSFWLWRHYESNLTETLYMSVGACIPFLTFLMVVIPRVIAWERSHE